MSNDTMNERQHVDVNGLNKEQVDAIAVQISGEITKMIDEVALQANKMLDIYGLEVKMQAIFAPKGFSKQQIMGDQSNSEEN